MPRVVKKHDWPIVTILISCIENHKNDEAISIMTNKHVNASGKVGSSKGTLLHYAAEYDNSTFAQYLIDKGCEVDVKDKYNKTPLMRATYHLKENAIRTLLAAGAQINDFKANKKHFMVKLMKSRSSKHLKVIKLLFDKLTENCLNNDDIAQKLFEIHCPFAAVIFLKNVEVTKRMLDLGCSIDELLPGTNETALHLAVHFLDIEHVKILVDRGANVNARDISGHTPLFQCNIHSEETDKKLELMSFLLNHGASLTEAFGDSYFTFMSELLSGIGSRTLQVLIPYIDFFAKNDNKRTLFHYLMENKSHDIVSVLQEQTFKFPINKSGINGFTPVDIAALKNNVEMVQFILENNAHTNDIDFYGRSLFNVMKQGNQTRLEANKTKRIIELFLQYGANAQFLVYGNFPIFRTWLPLIRAEPILAHLAMIESFGEPLNIFVCLEIQCNYKFKDYFESCKAQVEKMKDTIIYESISVHMLLFQREQLIAKYALNREFASSYKLFVKTNKSQINPYYISTLELRVGKRIDLVQIKREAAEIICEIIGLPSSMNGTIGQNVVKYLQRRDLNNLCKYKNVTGIYVL